MLFGWMRCEEIREIKSEIYSANVSVEEHFVYSNSDGDVAFKLFFFKKISNK